MKKLVFRFMIFALTCSFGSCVSTTLIKTDVEGVEVFADGEPLGTAPVYYSDKKISGMKTLITFKKQGCKDLEFEIARTEEVQIGPLIGGICIYIPFLWMTGYSRENSYAFECVKTKN